MNLLGKIQAAEWAKAKEFFNHPRNKHEIKFSKKRNPRYAKTKHPENFHSFIKIKNTIYAMANHEYIGEGNFGAVKIIQNETGENFALKIEKIILDIDMNMVNKQRATELKILSKIKDPHNQRYLKGYTEYNGKRYTVTSLIEGEDLTKHPEIARTYFKKLMVALQATKALKMIHDHDILHGDFKPSNLMYFEDENGIKIYPVDYGMSFLLKKHTLLTKLARKKRTTLPLEYDVCAPFYRAPEVEEGNCINKKSDIYSLGIILETDIELPPEIYLPLLNEDQSKRPSCNKFIKFLKLEIKNVNKRSIGIAKIIMNLFKHLTSTTDVQFTVLNKKNILQCKFNNMSSEKNSDIFYAIKIVFKNYEISFDGNDSGILNIDLDENKEILLNNDSVIDILHHINIQRTKMSQISQFFERIKQARTTLKSLNEPQELFSQISKRNILSIYDYLLRNKIELEDELWETANEILPIYVKLRANTLITIAQHEGAFHLVITPDSENLIPLRWQLDAPIPIKCGSEIPFIMIESNDSESSLIDDELTYDFPTPLLFSMQANPIHHSLTNDDHQLIACSSSQQGYSRRKSS
ncbi:MAG: protein kinase [Gammaproteobacteria bacterium]|jgi:serine/threonine protein kinase|nr:protein kinase [Gammaproteobacteria bacterium]